MDTPMTTDIRKVRDSDSDPVDPSLYRQLIGSLMYLVNTRPDICFVVNTLGQFQEEPRHEHWTAAKHCYPRYLGITRRSCLEAHMVLDMEYREQERLEHGSGGPIFLLLGQLCPVSSTSLHNYRPGLASERTLAP
jgi:hypothetical protein